MNENDTISDVIKAEEAVPTGPKLQALDIAELLQQRLVFLSGAQDNNGNVIISLPDNSKFGKIPDLDIEKIFKYLVGLVSPPLQRKGFALVLDRRKDKWNTVKTALLKIQNCFPATISCVYLLKPQGFFQKYSQPGFVSLNMQVLTLDSTSELYKYVNKDQLTKEFGGNLQFSSMEWVQHRTAIERFELNTVSYDQRLDSLQQYFSKTKIPASIEEIHTMVQLHEEMWNDVREDISSTVEAGMTLRSCIYPKNTGGKNRDIPPDVQANTAHMDRILKELDILTTNFETFWQGHKTKIQQGLQLCYFEQEVGQITGQLMSALGNVSGTSDMGDTRSTAESLIEELKEFHAKILQESAGKAKALVTKGQNMAADSHYAAETINLRCRELEKLCDDFERAVQKREEDLKKAMDVHECLEQVSKWCNTGVDLLASQPLDRFQSSEGAEKALEEIDNFLKTPQGINLGKLNKMEKTSKELQNKFLAYRVKDTLKRIGEVNEMMQKRESSLRKLMVKRPVQPVAAISITRTNSQERRMSVPSTQSPAGDKSHGKIKVTHREKRRPLSIVLSPDTPPQSPLLLSSSRCKSVPNLVNETIAEDDPTVLKKSQQVVRELIETEKDYVSDLECIIKGYLREFDNAGSKIPPELFSQKHVVFGNIEQIYEFHKNEFLSELQACAEKPLQISDVFTGKLEAFEMYATYCKNKPTSEALRADYMSLPFFKECQMKLGHRLPLHSYLLKPVQRITKYQLLLREMMKYSHPSSAAHQDLREAHETMENVLRHVNDVMHSCGIKGYRGSLSDHGKLCLQDSFLVWHTSKKGLPPLKGRQRQVFLYEKMVIFSKKDEENSKEKVVYHYKSSIKMCDVGLTETVKGAPCKFELWLKGRTEVFVLQAISVGVKTRWVTSIRNLLQSQFDMFKGIILPGSKSTSCSQLNNLRSPELRRPVTNSPSGFALTSNPDRYSNKDEDQAEDVEDDDYYDSDEWSDDDDDDDNQSSSNTAQTQPVYTQTSYEGTRYIALASYTAVEMTEVSFEEGDILEVLRVGQSGWWFARHTTTMQEGWLPASYLELLCQ